MTYMPINVDNDLKMMFARTAKYIYGRTQDTTSKKKKHPCPMIHNKNTIILIIENSVYFFLY